ncbi:MAG: sensor histidine kinase [Paenibacillus sp.]|nr:sensor histidine kinase [Paenibacillus sp.]
MRNKPVVFAVLVLIFILIVVYVQRNADPAASSTTITSSESAPAPLRYIGVGWLVHWGETYDANTEWKPFTRATRAEMENYSGKAWLRLTIPDNLPARDPYLVLIGFKQFEATIDGKLAYSFNMDGNAKHIHPIMNIHPIQLTMEDSGKLLEIQMQWIPVNFKTTWNIMGTRYDMLWNALKSDWSVIVYVTLFLSAGLASAVLFLRRKQELLYMWFSLLATCAGFGVLYKMFLIQWLVGADFIYYWKDMLLPFGIYTFVGFYGEALRLSRHLVFRLMKGVLLGYTCISAWAGWFHPDLYWKLLVDYLPYSFAAVFVVVSIYVFVQHWKKRDRETLWLLIGYSILVLTMFIYLLFNLSNTFLQWLISLSRVMPALLEQELQGGLLLFMLCLSMVLVHRFSEVYRQVERHTVELAAKNDELETFHRSLEELVEIRTKELEKANQSLEASVRETAETLAEVSVLEERNRIAHEIHDVVGHTLTAAIVQLEASKKLAGHDLTKSVEKLDVINNLVRKGMEDIRRSVRLLKDEGEMFDLYAALEDLIRDTELTMGVDIDAHIAALPPLPWLTQRVIYHALQEGLTNGIRHGNCSSFTFSLLRDEQRVRFLLINDGTSFGSAKPGFGLTTMMERIHLLGGTVHVRANREDDGDLADLTASEAGCRLEITLPLH